jgi:amino acid adenylation domain-containing protein
VLAADDDEDDRAYVVVVNDEEQYSVWPADRDLPPGWRAADVHGPKATCLDYAGRLWTDLRPRSLREAPAAHPGTRQAARPAEFAPDIFWRRAAVTPDEIAIEAPDGTQTFAQLAGRVEVLAARLRALGAGPERHIAVLLPPGTELVIAIQAIWRAGAVYVPLDVDDPPPRLAAITGTLAFTAAVTDDAHSAAVPAGVPVVVPAAPPEPAPASAEARVQVHPESAAYVIFTSGTSGRPRGVVISHRSLAAYLAWAADDALAGRVVPALTRAAFDASLKQLVAPWRNGGSLWLLAHDVATYPDLLYDAITERDDLAVNCVPSLWRMLLELDDDPLTGGRLGACVARALIGGEPIDAELLTRFRERMPATELVNLYGPTEATCNALAGVIEVTAGPAPLGRPLPGTSAYVLDDELRPVLPGGSGNLFIGGCGVARGYAGDPRRTAAVFLPDPYTGRAGERMYDTGDIVQIRPDGSLIYLRRRDLQVKIRGHRVELEDVERALQENAAVSEAVAVVRHSSGNELVVFVTPKPGGRLDRAEVLRELATRVPLHLVPARLVVADALPRTAGGKPDRSILRSRADTA